MDTLPGHDTHENAQTGQLADAVFGNEENADKTASLIGQFLVSYAQRQEEQPVEHWLTDEFRKFPAIWHSEEELVGTARDIVQSIQQVNDNKLELYAHLNAGKSRESWLAKKIEQGAAAAGVNNFGEYAGRIDQTLTEANALSREAILTIKGQVNRSDHLHGFLAEHELANRFNLDAAASGSTLRARVLGSRALDSTDLEIYNSAGVEIRDAAGDLIDNIQVKSYADTNLLVTNIRSHNYPSGTVLMVHEGQVERLQTEFPNLKVVSRYEIDGVQVDMPSYEDLKAQQEQAQRHQEALQYEWNDVRRIKIAKEIGKKALIGAAIVAGIHAARILGRRVWNTLKDKENPPASEDLREFFQSSLRSGTQVGVQVAVTGAVVVAVKNGLIKVLQNTPAGQIANIVYIGLENAKVLYKLSKGEVNAIEAMDAMGNVTCSVVGGLGGAAQGGAFGFAMGGPIGSVIGAIAGGIAGGIIGEAVFAGGKEIVKTAAKVVDTVWEGTKDTAKAAGRVLNPANWLV